jgi:hypothetical protein
LTTDIACKKKAAERRVRMFALSRRAAILFTFAAVAPNLGGCNEEAGQRAAFIGFLQNRIINKPGLHIPILSNKEIADIGPYADQYRIMSGFHQRLNEAIAGDIDRATKIGSPHSLQELADHRAILPLLKASMSKMKDALDKAEADADAAHKSLQQPPDLKTVYDTAYEHMVTKPAEAYRQIVSLMLSAFPAVADLAEYLDAHRDAISYRGDAPVSNDPAVQSMLVTLMKEAAKSSEISAEGKRKMRAMLGGQ